MRRLHFTFESSKADASEQPNIAFSVLGLCGLSWLSGVAGLGYQMVWNRLLSVSLGHEMMSILAVISAFFIGLALGGYLAHRYISQSSKPHFWYIAMELVIASWSIALTLVIPSYNQWMPLFIGAEPPALLLFLKSFLTTLLLLLPATLAMGATLPVLEKIASQHCPSRSSIALLYAFNTFGAVVGTLATVFYFIPTSGLLFCLVLFATFNVICALVTWGFYRIKPTLMTPSAVAPQPPQWAANPFKLKMTLLVTGLLGIGLEISAVRTLSQAFENTVYSFACVLSVFLLGTASGAGIYHRLLRTPWYQARCIQGEANLLVPVLLATALSCLLSLVSLPFSQPVYLFVWQSFGYNPASAIIGELTATTLVLALPTMCMGFLFSYLAGLAKHSIGLGQAFALNAFGCALAPPLYYLFLVPILGIQSTLLITASSYLLLAFYGADKAVLKDWIAIKPKLRSRAILTYSPLVISVFLLFYPLNLTFLGLTEQSKLLAYRQGVLSSVAVVENASGVRYLKVNNHFTMGGTASRYSDHRQTHIPMLLHGQPRSALYLGLGTGITFEATQYYPGLQATGVELIPEVLDLMPYFVEPATERDHSRRLAADARRYVTASDEQYDVIVGEIFHPSRDGAGALYTREHFAAVKQRLAENGLFAQWLPLFQLDLATLRLITRTFIDAFPHSQMYLGHHSLDQPILCLVGSLKPRAYSDQWLLHKVNSRDLQKQLVLARLNSDLALFGGLLADANALKQFAGDGPLNTDNFPRVTFSAPYFVYSRDTTPAQRLAQLIKQLPPPAIDDTSAVAWPNELQGRLVQYRTAQNAFLLLGAETNRGQDQWLWAQTVTPALLKLVEQSPEFTPAYRTLLGIAQGFAASQPKFSYSLLRSLDSAAPQFPEARRLQQKLF